MGKNKTAATHYSDTPSPRPPASFLHLFGPVRSRRLGLSLGVDMVPFKTCTLDCVYCECGATTSLTVGRMPYVASADILDELNRYMQANQRPDYITFGGSGEPTLNSDLGRTVRAVKRRHPSCKTALLTNGTLFTDPAVRAECLVFDLALPSLDAVSPGVFAKVNRCHASLDNARIIDGLAAFVREFTGPVWLEVFIVPGVNDTEEELRRFKDAITRIAPARVQLNSLDRPPADPGVREAPPGLLDRIAAVLRPLPVEIIPRRAAPAAPAAPEPNAAAAVLAACRRRPLTVEDAAVTAGMNINEAAVLLETLVREKRLTTDAVGARVFYRA